MNKIKEVWAQEHIARKEGLHPLEYGLWWLMRIALFVVLCMLIKEKVIDEGDFSIRIPQVGGCLLATFTVPLVRKLFFFVKPFRRITFRTQTWLNITIFLTSFFGQGLDFYHEIPTWDKYMHFFSGGLVVLIGNEIIEAFSRKGDRISPFNRTMAASGFSFFVIVIWELYEFTMDYFWPGSALQRYEIGDEEDHFLTLFYKIFGDSVNNHTWDEETAIIDGVEQVISKTEITHWQLYDTNIDMLYAFICCVAVSLGLIVFYTVKEKKQNKKSAIKQEETVAA